MLVRFLIIALPLLFVIKSCLGQVNSPGKCPRVRTEPNFNAFLEAIGAEGYEGLWFDYSRYFTAFQIGTQCSRARYRLRRDGKIDVRNSGFNTRSGMRTGVRGFAFAPNPKVPGRLIVNFPSSPSPPDNYLVLDTDYRNFSIVYNCRNIGGPYHRMKSEILFILSRSPGRLPLPSQRRILRVLKWNRIDPGPLMRTRQRGCPKGL